MSLLTASDKALWRLALPMIFSNITVPLLGLVDTAVIGHLDSPVYLGGVAIGATVPGNPLAQRTRLAGKSGSAGVATGRAVRPRARDFAGGG